MEWTFTHREIGLPVWQGRCDMAANSMTVEAATEALGIEAAVPNHQVVGPEIASETCSTCASPDPLLGSCRWMVLDTFLVVAMICFQGWRCLVLVSLASGRLFQLMRVGGGWKMEED